MTIDPVTLQILANHCAAATESMAHTLVRTAHSTFVKETEDFTTGLSTVDGKTFASPFDLGATWFVGLDYEAAINMIDVYEEGDLIKRAIRDMYDNDTNNIVVDGNEGYQKAKNFMKFLMPENVKKIKKYRGKIPLFHDVQIERSLNRIFEPTVKLESGGYIVINPTEALVSIDVNSGQSIKESNIEKTALKTNLEAVEEISRQIKIRDLSGLIVIDFIDLQEIPNRKKVYNELRTKLIKDRETNRSRGFGFVSMDDDAAETAISSLDGSEVDGRNLKVNKSKGKS